MTQLTQDQRVRLIMIGGRLEDWLEKRYNPERDMAPQYPADKYDVFVVAREAMQVIAILLSASVEAE